MNFRFDVRKATQVAGWFIQKEGGEMNIMKLVKLVYLLDRLSLQRRGLPVLGGDYFSMKNGPVTSEFLDLLNAGSLDGVLSDWEQFISDRTDHVVALRAEAQTDRLSESELLLMGEIYSQHGQKNPFQLVEWCHHHCSEWHPGTQGRREIRVEDILESVGKTPEQICQIVAEEDTHRCLDSILG